MGAISMRASSVLLCGVLAFSATACKSTSGSGAAKEDLALVPKEADIVLMANVARIRNTAMWRKLLDVRDSDAQAKKDYEEFVQKCALDPFKQIDSVFVAFPQGGGAEKEFAAILRGQFNEGKLVECAKNQAKKDGRDLTTSDYNGHKLYTDNQKGEAYATFLDGKTAVVGGKEWVKKVIDLASNKGESAKSNATLATLMKRAKTSDALWGAGIVPQTTRDQFKNDPRLSSAATMKDIFGSVDFASGVNADLNVDTGSEADAKDLAAKATAQLAEIRKSPQFMMMGLAQYLDGLKIDSKGETFHLGLVYNQQQVDDLINRVKGLLKSFGGAMGGMPSPPPNQ
ncbi:MAG: hypothetical protein JWN44_23 [Myxococcales bacterium]|nr:hypothetical protein [Myxococcales bacterium]